jgi:type I restriction enzyme M protein
MDDMDKEAIELGGKPSFFTGDYERYGWSKIFDPRIGGYEMLNLYAEAITRMSQNPNLPQLFRDIFKNAYLPYRNPETLKLFLKTINEFTYDHSERLGDAFEYLLSVLGSQGDAGQFRTPRHIIDFMVEVIDPKKHETILDPACGTAGFLISAYKHILRENTSEKYKTTNSNNGTYRGDLLNTEERKKLLTNFKGYDISPDMVRLSLVNMYLHGFVQPQIYEYDTLTSEDRWNEYADVILANPPFMTPKGGIKPHKRFSVQSNRSEVLFVDYIAEHLTPTGRAAVIVPEGIIFQSANAYKQLRKMIVENYLYAVVSLPAGVFQPYSGVKTSILFMDKQLAKKTNSILFVKIENDGYDLGAQRRPIDKNDLPDALNLLRGYTDAIKNGKTEQFTTEGKTCAALLVKKEKLAENGEYNLTGDRYRIVERTRHQKWPMVRLGDVCEIINGQSPEGEFYNEQGDGTPFYQGKTEFTEIYIGNPKKWTTKETKIAIKDDILISVRAPVGPVNICTRRACIGRGLAAIRVSNKILMWYSFYLLKTNEKKIKGNGGAVFDSISKNDIENILIPLPPLEVQQEIVAEIEGYQKLIDGCKQVIDNWKPDVEGYLEEERKTYLAQHPEEKDKLKDGHRPEPVEGWPMVKLGEVCEEIKSGFACGNSEKDNGEILHLRPMNISSNGILVFEGSKFISKDEFDSSYNLKAGDILFNNTNSKELVGKTCYVERDLPNTGYSNHLTRIRTKKELNSKFLAIMLQDLFKKGFFINLCNKWVGQAGINNKILSEILIPLPPLEVQQRIVDRIESERKIIEGCKEMIKIYEEKIKRVIDRVWGGRSEYLI